jgi:TRAP-type C4-dicarboxylate transport system substrate-binding protein
MQSKGFFKSASTILGILCFVMFPMVSLAAEVNLKLGHVAPSGPTTHDVSSTKFAERVAVNTGGKVEIKVFGNSQFGGLQEHWAQVKSGAIDVFVQDVSASSMVEPEPKNFHVMLAPYVFDSQEHYQKFIRSDLFKSMMAKVEKAANLKFIGYLGDRTPRGFTTTSKQAATPNELKGLKLRVPELPIFVDTYKAWGANPTPVSAKDLYTSLKSGMVEGMDQDITMTYAAKYYEIQKYFVAIDYNRSGMGCWMNAKKWEALPADLQAAFLKSGQETEAYVNKFTAQQMAEAEKGLTEAGCKIIRPDLKPWKELAEKEVLKNDGKLWEKGLYDRIKAIK